MVASEAWRLALRGLVKSVQAYWRLAIAIIATIPATSCVQRFTIRAAGARTFSASCMVYLREAVGCRKSVRLALKSDGPPVDDSLAYQHFELQSTGLRSLGSPPDRRSGWWPPPSAALPPRASACARPARWSGAAKASQTPGGETGRA